MNSGNIFSFVIAGVAVLAVAAILIMAMGKKPQSGKNSKNANAKGKLDAKKTKSQAQIMKEAARRLSKNPHDPAGLVPLGDVYFTNSLWDKAITVYNNLIHLSATNTEIDAFTANLRAGICLVQLQKYHEALGSLSMAYKLNSRDYDVNYYLGYTFYMTNVFDKAAPCFKKALMIKPDATGVYLMLGQSLYKSHHFRDSLPYFKKALDEDPGNKEALFGMADAMAEEGFGDKAIKVFMHLRADPTYGARSCLQAGIYHAKNNDLENAIQDFEIGLKHADIPVDVKLELQYHLAQCYFSINKMAQGLNNLRLIRDVNPNYKDVNALINRYQELSQNKNLQVYLSSSTTDFVTLCRKIISVIYHSDRIKIQDISVGPVFTDVLANINAGKWEDLEVFRFFRTTSSTGEIYIRDFHGHMHDINADKGFCITAGEFSEEAHKFAEGRPLDLIEKTHLTKLLKQIS